MFTPALNCSKTTNDEINLDPRSIAIAGLNPTVTNDLVNNTRSLSGGFNPTAEIDFVSNQTDDTVLIPLQGT